MDQELCASPSCADEWEAPSFEEIRVSAEATAYMGVQDDWD
ncbi:pyrroloquinoline quinone precursor peptide PqqA [Geodermatophilus sp. URMC 60]